MGRLPMLSTIFMPRQFSVGGVGGEGGGLHIVSPLSVCMSHMYKKWFPFIIFDKISVLDYTQVYIHKI